MYAADTPETFHPPPHHYYLGLGQIKFTRGLGVRCVAR